MVNPFEYQEPGCDEIGRIEKLRAVYFECLQSLLDLTRQGSVSGRYVALARTALEESAMWAIKSIVFERDNGGYTT